MEVYRQLPKRLPRSLGFKRYTMYFDGVDDYVEIPDSDDFHTKEFTVEVAVLFLDFNPPGGIVTRNPVVVHKNWAGSPSWCIWAENTNNVPGRLHFDFIDSGGTRRNTVIPDQLKVGRWYVIHGVYDGCKSMIYVNGVKKAETDQGCNDFTNTAPLRLNRPTAEYMHGYIAWFRYYTRALGKDEIIHNIIEYHNPVRSGLVVWLHDRIADSTWYDESGHGNNGAIYGATKNPITTWELRTKIGL